MKTDPLNAYGGNVLTLHHAPPGEGSRRRPADDIVVVVEADDGLGEDLDAAARRLVASGLHRVRSLIPALRAEGYPRRRDVLHQAARAALLANGIQVRRGGPRRQ
jgi:hypothetical protein